MMKTEANNLLALDLGGTMIKAGLVSPGGVVTEYRETPSRGKEGGEALLREAALLTKQYSGYDRLGVSTAGQVDVQTGTIRYANENIPRYTGTQVRSIFQELTQVPVAVENDVNAAALGEAKFGAGRDCPHFLCLTYGTGIGGGIVIDGQVYHGAHGIAGELGHIVTHPGGRACGCGQLGCYEPYASTTALVRAASAQNPAVTNGRELFARLDEMSDVLDGWIDEIALGLVSLIHVLDPGAVVLGGGIMQEPYILPRLTQKLLPLLMESYRDVELKTAELGNRAGLLGAAWLASQL